MFRWLGPRATQRCIAKWWGLRAEHSARCGVQMNIMRESTLLIHVLLLSLAASAQSGPKVAPSKKATPKATQPAPGEDWLVWGGKNRDFKVDSSGLADSWPAAGPKKLWSRDFGDGYSAIAEEGGVLYTGFRRGGNDVITAIDANTGKMIWE